MTEYLKDRLLDLKARQESGGQMCCPRCGQDKMKPVLHTNALSRHADQIYVCDTCGTAEAMLDFMKQELPLTMWAFFQTKRDNNNYTSLPSTEVLTKVLCEHVGTLKRIYSQCLTEPKHQDEYRLIAYESCPGLSELWTDPFTARFDSKDSPIILRFRQTTDGEIEVAANIIDPK